MCLAAVQQNGWALEFVEHFTPEICLAAVRQNKYALQFVNDEKIKMGQWGVMYGPQMTLL